MRPPRYRLLCHDWGFGVTVSEPNDSAICAAPKTIADVWTTQRTSLIIKRHIRNCYGTVCVNNNV